MTEKSPDTLLTSAQVRAIFGGISDMSLWRWLSLPEMCFPKPIYIARRRFWREAEIAAWQAAQAQAKAPEAA
jgi:predicted DNA-binding transcriptional regulator AlpA